MLNARPEGRSLSKNRVSIRQIEFLQKRGVSRVRSKLRSPSYVCCRSARSNVSGVLTDVRVIAATNRDLQADISGGSFRRDLFYRLNVFPIEIPPLRKRRQDIRLLVEYFVDRYARKAGKNITSVDKKTLQLFESYAWPGNIRELQNVIERSVILSDSEALSVQESWLRENSMPMEPKNASKLNAIQARTKSMIEAALRESRGRVFGPSGAAAKLGIPRSTLESKIRSLKIDKNHFKPSPAT